jgi:hypothetical protein
LAEEFITLTGEEFNFIPTGYWEDQNGNIFGFDPIPLSVKVREIVRKNTQPVSQGLSFYHRYRSTSMEIYVGEMFSTSGLLEGRLVDSSYCEVGEEEQ